MSVLGFMANKDCLLAPSPPCNFCPLRFNLIERKTYLSIIIVTMFQVDKLKSDHRRNLLFDN